MKYKLNRCEIDSDFGSPVIGVPSGEIIPVNAGDLIQNEEQGLFLVQYACWINVRDLSSSKFVEKYNEKS